MLNGPFMRVGSFLCVLLCIQGCRNQPKTNEPTLTDTTIWMAQALSSHNGQRLEVGGQVNKLTTSGCHLTYETLPGDTVEFDLSDINPATITTKQIGNATWVVFDTRDFHKSIHYVNRDEPKGSSMSDYSTEDGGFSLDSPEHADSFMNAVKRGVTICGGKPSTF